MTLAHSVEMGVWAGVGVAVGTWEGCHPQGRQTLGWGSRSPSPTCTGPHWLESGSQHPHLGQGSLGAHLIPELPRHPLGLAAA